MQNVRICLVGAGRAGMVHAQNFQHHIKSTSVAGVVDVSEAAGRKAAEILEISAVFTDLEAALQSVDFDAVCIGAPAFAHAEAAVQAAQKGKHILCEKPLALSLEEVGRMEDAVKGHGVKCQVGFMRRYDENFLAAEQLIRKGAIGEPILVKSLGRGPGLPPGSWFFDLSKSNGLLAEVNSHDFDTVRWLTGSEIEQIYSLAGNFKCKDVETKYPDFYDTVTSSLRLKNGSLGMVDGCCPAVYGFEARVEVLGTEGMLQIGSKHSTSVLVWNKNSQLVHEGNKSWRTLFKDAYLKADTDFADCIIQNREPLATIVDGKKAVEVVVAGNRSLRTGRPVKVES